MVICIRKMGCYDVGMVFLTNYGSTNQPRLFQSTAAKNGRSGFCYNLSMDLLSFLAENNISFERFDHPAVFTVEESSKLPPIPGAGTKNLFLRDEKGSRFFLASVSHEKRVSLKDLGKILAAKKLSFGSPEMLKQYLGVEPGSVTLLGLIHDVDHRVEVIIDQELWDAEQIQCHPLVNTATLIISHDGLEKFMKVTGHEPRVLVVPER